MENDNDPTIDPLPPLPLRFANYGIGLRITILKGRGIIRYSQKIGNFALDINDHAGNERFVKVRLVDVDYKIIITLVCRKNSGFVS